MIKRHPIAAALILAYLVMAYWTGSTRERDCEPGYAMSPKYESSGSSAGRGLTWPYTLYVYYVKTGSVANFFHRVGYICNPTK